MKTYGGSEDTAAQILTSALDGAGQLQAGWAPEPVSTLCSCRSPLAYHDQRKDALHATS
jgi:hypothetical protein